MKTLLFFVFIIISGVGYSQTTITQAPLSYEPTIPNDSTFTVVKNTTGATVPDSVLLQINLYRMNADYLWRVNSEIEILIEGIEN